MEKNRYEHLLQKFLEMGGSRNMQLNGGDIELKTVHDLQLEEGFYMENYHEVGVRRRRKVSRKKGGARPEADAAMQEELAMMGSQQTTNEDEIMRQVNSRRGWTNNPSFSPEMMGMQMQVKIEPGLMPEHVTRHLPGNRMPGHHYTRGGE